MNAEITYTELDTYTEPANEIELSCLMGVAGRIVDMMNAKITYTELANEIELSCLIGIAERIVDILDSDKSGETTVSDTNIKFWENAVGILNDVTERIETLQADASRRKRYAEALAYAQMGVDKYARRKDLTQELIQAIRASDLSEVKRLVAAGAEVGTRDALSNRFFGTDNDCPLSAAILANRENIVRFLYEQGASTGFLLPSEEYGLIGAFELLLTEGDGYFNPAILTLIVENTPDINETYYPPLLECARSDNYALIVPYLLAHGADPNRRSDSEVDETALHVCALNNSVEVAEILLQNGAEIDALSKGGDTDWAASRSYTPLMVALYFGNESIARLLIKRGASLDYTNDKGENALSCAIEGGKLSEMVELLLDRGLSPNGKLSDGKTFLELAKESGNEEIVNLMTARIQEVTSSDLLDEASCSPLDWDPVDIALEQGLF